MIGEKVLGVLLDFTIAIERCTEGEEDDIGREIYPVGTQLMDMV